jgi:hypothetical protein
VVIQARHRIIKNDDLVSSPQMLVKCCEEEGERQCVPIPGAKRATKGWFTLLGSPSDRDGSVVDQDVVVAGRPASVIGSDHLVETKSSVEALKILIDRRLIARKRRSPVVVKSRLRFVASRLSASLRCFRREIPIAVGSDLGRVAGLDGAKL